jgi:hypothetical protein
MNDAQIRECANCGQPVIPERRNYRYTESGISNVILQGIDVADCSGCGNSEVMPGNFWSVPPLRHIRAIRRVLIVNNTSRAGAARSASAIRRSGSYPVKGRTRHLVRMVGKALDLVHRSKD